MGRWEPLLWIVGAGVIWFCLNLAIGSLKTKLKRGRRQETSAAES